MPDQYMRDLWYDMIYGMIYGVTFGPAFLQVLRVFSFHYHITYNKYLFIYQRRYIIALATQLPQGAVRILITVYQHNKHVSPSPRLIQDDQKVSCTWWSQHTSYLPHYVAQSIGVPRGVKPTPKFRSFDKAEPNFKFRGIYFRNNLIRIWVSFICKLSGTPRLGGYHPQISVPSPPSVLNWICWTTPPLPRKISWRKPPEKNYWVHHWLNLNAW
jgi:hypothetical protein